MQNNEVQEWQRTFLNAGTEKGLGDLSMMISVVSEILTSRDTYWKESKTELIKTIIERFETHGIAYLNTLKDITNEDNLK